MVCPSGDAVALAEAVLTLYRLSPAERTVMGEAARAHFEQEFKMSSLIEKLSAWLIEATSDDLPSPQGAPLHGASPQNSLPVHD